MSGRGEAADARRKGLEAAALLLVVGGAFLLRIIPFLALPSGAGYPIIDADSLYHLRLAQLIFHDYPRIPGFDPYINFPIGAEVPWPVLQDFATATCALLLGLSQDGLAALCFFTPALLGALSTLPVFFLARNLGMERWPAVGAAALAGLVPIHLQYTFAGIYDHHAGDVALMGLFLWALLLSWSARSTPARTAVVLGAQAGLALVTVLMFLNWQGSVVYVGFFLLAAFCSHVSAPRDPALHRWFARAASSLAVSAILLSLWNVSAFGPARMTEIVLAQPSAFHPLFLAASASALLTLGVYREKGRRIWRHLLLGFAVAVFLGSVTLLAGPGLEAVLTYLAGGNRVFAPFPEFIPPFSSRSGGPGISLARGVGLLSWGVLLVPLAFLAVLRGWWRREDGWELEPFPRHLLLVLLGGLLLLALWQARWGHVFAVACGLAAGVALSLTWRRARGKGRAGCKAVAGGATLLAALGFLVPAVELTRGKWDHPYAGLQAYPLLPTLTWLRDHTPAPSDYRRPDEPPSYGVLALPVEGHAVIALARRPAMATSFGNTLPGGLLKESLVFFTETDSDKARNFMQRNRLRYLLLPHPRVVNWVASNLLEPGTRASGTTPSVTEVLWEFAGSSWEGDAGPVEGAHYWRLLWEDEQPDGGGHGGVVPTKLFELVPGAVLEGRAPPGSWVSVRLTLMTRLRPEVPWQGVARADVLGRFSLVVPYPTESASGTTRPLGPYRVKVPGREVAAISVSEEDVAKGNRVEVR